MGDLVTIGLGLVVEKGHVAIELEGVFVSQRLALFAVVMIHKIEETDVGGEDTGQ